MDFLCFKEIGRPEILRISVSLCQVEENVSLVKSPLKIR